MIVEITLRVPASGDMAPAIWSNRLALEGNKIDPAELINAYDALRHGMLVRAEEVGATLDWGFSQKGGPRKPLRASVSSPEPDPCTDTQDGRKVPQD